MSFFRKAMEWLDGPAGTPKAASSLPSATLWSETDALQCRAEINRLVAAFLSERRRATTQLAQMDSCSMGYRGLTARGSFYLNGSGWIHHMDGHCSFALNTDGRWSYVGYYGVRTHHGEEQVELWQVSSTLWLEIDQKEFAHFTDSGSASPRHALAAARDALAAWRQ